MSPDRLDRVHGALLGLAVGDAIGLPADYHRTVRSPWVRSRMWLGSADLDRAQVAKPLIPFDATTVDGTRLMPTDDTEAAVLAARAALTADPADPDALFAQWRRHALADDVWTGIAERSAIVNAKRGEVPPVTGSDNPADASDSAVPAGVVFGLLHTGDPASASAEATRWASITHARDGVWAAAAMAVAVAELADGRSVEAALELAVREAPEDSWLAAGFRTADDLGPVDVFLDLPRILSALSPRLYSQPGTAAETLPLAFLLLRATRGKAETALPLAALFARESDSVPAFVGALCGAASGAAGFGSRLPESIDRIEGLFYPSLAGESLMALAAEIASRRA